VSNVIENSVNKQEKMLKIIQTENMFAKASGGYEQQIVIVLEKKFDRKYREVKAKFFDSNGWQSIVPITQIYHQVKYTTPFKV